jgi:hypothetical protein
MLFILNLLFLGPESSPKLFVLVLGLFRKLLERVNQFGHLIDKLSFFALYNYEFLVLKVD